LPSGTFIFFAGIAILWCIFLTYHELRQEKNQLDQQLAARLEISETPLLQEYPVNTGETSRLFYVAVRNPSSSLVRNVSVLLTEINPPAADLAWLPVHLHIKHDNGPGQLREMFDLNPGSVRHIDLTSRVNGHNRPVTVHHIVSGANRELPSTPTVSYLFSIRAEAANLPLPAEAKFLIRVNSAGQLVCLPGAFTDLDKGFVEFRRDAKQLLNRLIKQIGLLLIQTQRITTVLAREAGRMTWLNSEQITRLDRVMGFRVAADRFRVLGPIFIRFTAWRIIRAVRPFERTAKVYRSDISALVTNLTGWVETSTTVAGSDVHDMESLQSAINENAEQLTHWRATTMTTRNLRISRQLNRSLDRLIFTQTELLNATDQLKTALPEIVSLAKSRMVE
jgi:hypothetical protein